MNNLESNPPLIVGFGGGGSTGKTTAGFLDAIESGAVETDRDVRAFAFVGTADDGSTTGRLRNLYNTPAVGDIRRSISALSGNQDAAFDFERRFDADSTVETVATHTEQLLATLSYGPNRLSAERAEHVMRQTIDLSRDLIERDIKGLTGVALGHLVMTALTLESDIDQASHEAGDLMGTRAEVIPVSLESHGLIMRDGRKVLEGEHMIDEHVVENPADVEVSLTIDVPINPRLQAEITAADMIVIGPGSVYTSMVPALLPEGMQQALADKDVTIVGNLVNQPTETAGWSGDQYVKVTEKYLGRQVTRIVFNSDTQRLPNAVVFDRASLENHGPYQVVAAAMVKDGEIIRDPNDPLYSQRSTVEHDMSAVAQALVDADSFELAA